jgi:hypothetical protein
MGFFIKLIDEDFYRKVDSKSISTEAVEESDLDNLMR